MKPLKFLLPLFRWVMRISLVLYAYVMYFDVIAGFQFGNLGYFVALIFSLFSVLLLVGGLLRDSSITVISALILMLLELYQLTYSVNPSVSHSFAIFLMIMAITGYFLASGNDKS